MKGYRARIYHTPLMFDRDLVTLVVYDADTKAMLQPDGTWHIYAEGEETKDPGIILPAETVEAIAQAIERYQGHASHADTETRVLREWLAVERGRVDKALKRG